MPTFYVGCNKEQQQSQILSIVHGDENEWYCYQYLASFPALPICASYRCYLKILTT